VGGFSQGTSQLQTLSISAENDIPPCCLVRRVQCILRGRRACTSTYVCRGVHVCYVYKWGDCMCVIVSSLKRQADQPTSRPNRQSNYMYTYSCVHTHTTSCERSDSHFARSRSNCVHPDARKSMTPLMVYPPGPAGSIAVPNMAGSKQAPLPNHASCVA